jgi:hypothetical protein
MALQDIVIPTRTIAYGGASFTVHGVTANDVMRMLIDADKDVARALNALEAARGADDENTVALLGTFLREVPELVARVIASAADEPASWPIVLKLPVSIQTEALEAVWSMTFEEPDSVKKFAASLVEMAKSIKTLTPKAA